MIAAGVDVAGSGSAERPQPDLVAPGARAIIRYADSAAWITAAAVARATSLEWLAEYSHDVAVVVVADQGPADTMAQVQAAAEAGFSSPLRYAAASPGSLAGVSCIAFGFRGPTLNLAMLPADGMPTAMLMARGWLARGAAHAVVVASFSGVANVGQARAALLMPGAGPVDGGDVTTTVQWLADVGR
jgi:hypothetical protein